MHREVLLMDIKNGFGITKRDRVMRAWQNSTELVRDYQSYAHEIKDDHELAELFAKYAEDEAVHAASFLELLRTYEK